MGIGDELMAAGEARQARRMGGPRVTILDKSGNPRSHLIWAYCPDVGPGGATLINGPGARPYVDYAASTGGAWRWKRYRPTPAAIDLPGHLLAATAAATGRIVIEPTIKAKASPNKSWGWHRWEHLVRLRPDLPWLQIGPPGTRVLRGVTFLTTPTPGHMLAALRVARAAVLPEGGMHHAAAAVGLPAVVIFGGYISPDQTGYEGHVNIFTGGEPCGSRGPCQHCEAALAMIAPRTVARELDNLLKRGRPMGLIEHGGVWLPAGETHLIEWMDKRREVVDGRLSYQHHKLRVALDHCRSFRRAVDIGAHCGLWSMHLVKRFAAVEAFEPVALHRDAFERNVPGGKARLWPVALGAERGRVAIHTAPTSSGDSWVDGAGDIPLERLDDLLPDADDVDFVKADCEGFELFALQGAERMLLRCRPTVCVEQKPGRAQKFGLPERGAVDWLVARGWVLRAEMSGDFILTGA